MVVHLVSRQEEKTGEASSKGLAQVFSIKKQELLNPALRLPLVS
jgi:hypothetical protein